MKRKIVLSPNEIDSMATSAPDLRDEVFIKLLYYTAVRITELISLTVSDVDLETPTITIRHLKRAGEMYRSIGISNDTANLLRQYIRSEGLQEGERLFPFTRQWGYQIIRQAAERVDLGGKVMLNLESGKRHFVHPHNLRESFATRALKADTSIEGQIHLQKHLGHKDFSTTVRYIKFLPEERSDWLERVWGNNESK